MKQPGPDHPITIEPHHGRVRVRVGGSVVADTVRALVLREAALPPVQYIPREDIAADLFEPSPLHTHCPFKGEASYWTATAGGLVRPDCAWSYERPYEAVAAIAGYFAFYPDRVDSANALD